MPEKEEIQKAPKIIISSLQIVLFIILFLLGISLLKESINSLQTNYDIKEFFSLDNLKSIHYFAIGWIGTMVLTSGSSMASIIVGLAPSGLIDSFHSTIVVMGSRIGPDTILIIAGLFAAIKTHSFRKGFFIPILEFSITALIAIATFLLFPIANLIPLGQEIFNFSINIGPDSFDIIGGSSRFIHEIVGNFWTFSIGGICFFLALKVFDELTDTNEPELKQVEEKRHSTMKDLKRFLKTRELSYLLYSPILSFFLGLIITLITISASISVALLIPLYAKKRIPISSVIGFVIGSNIGTFGDTLILTMLTSNSEIIRSIFIMVLLVVIISLLFLLLIKPLTKLGEIIEIASKSFLGIIIIFAIMILPPVIILTFI